MAKVLMTARERFPLGGKTLMPGDTFAASSVTEAKRLMRQNLARPKSVVAAINRAMSASGTAARTTGNYHTK